MGSLVAAHLVRNEPPVELLARLPPSIGWRLHREPVTAAFLIEVFASSAKPPTTMARIWPAVPSPAGCIGFALKRTGWRLLDRRPRRHKAAPLR
jgi:hypothetical protein